MHAGKERSQINAKIDGRLVQWESDRVNNCVFDVNKFWQPKLAFSEAVVWLSMYCCYAVMGHERRQNMSFHHEKHIYFLHLTMMHFILSTCVVKRWQPLLHKWAGGWFVRSPSLHSWESWQFESTGSLWVLTPSSSVAVKRFVFFSPCLPHQACLCHICLW